MRGEAHYFHIVEGEPLPDISRYAPFKAVLIIETAVSSDWQTVVCRWLVASGCLNTMSWGAACESWHDSVDIANLEKFDWGEVPDDQLVMTTWHSDDPLDEVFWFANFVAFHPKFELATTVLIDIADTDRKAEMLDRLEAAVTS